MSHCRRLTTWRDRLAILVGAKSRCACPTGICVPMGPGGEPEPWNERPRWKWRSPALLGIAALLPPAPAIAADIVQQSPTTFSGTDFQRNSGVIGINPGRGPYFSPAAYGADVTGATDATAAIQAAQAACSAGGGGEIRIDGQRLLHTGNITVVEGCPIRGSYTPAYRSSVDYNHVKSVLLHPAGVTVTLDTGGELSGVAVLSSTLPAIAPVTVKDGATLVRGMASAGTGVTHTGKSPRLRDVLIAGFNQGILSNGPHQIKMDGVFLDNFNSVSISFSHDISVLHQVEAWPFLTASQSWTAYSGAITGVADNGAGKPRVTSPTDSLTTGDPVFVSAVVGFSGVNTKCIVAIVDLTHFDCANLQTAPTGTAAVTAGNNAVKLTAPNVSVSNGQTVTDSAGLIPGGTIVVWVDQSSGWVWLNQKATGTNAADTLTFTNGAYASGGIVQIDNNYRAGAGFYLENNVLLVCEACFAYGYARNFDMLDERNDQFVASASDFSSSLQDPTSIGVYMRGISRSNTWFGGYFHGSGTPLVHNTTDTLSPNLFSGIPWIYQGPVATDTLALLGGSVSIVNSYIYKGHTISAPIFVADNTKVRLNGNDFSGASGFWSILGASQIRNVNTTFTPLALAAGFAPSSIMSGTTGTAVAAGATVVFRQGQQPSPSGGPTVREPIPSPGRMRNLYVDNTVAPDTGSHVVILQRNGVDSTLACTVPTGARSCNSRTTGFELIFGAGDNWNFKAVNSAGVTSTIKASVEWVPDQ